MTSTSSARDFLPAIVILVVLTALAATGAGIYGWSLAGAATALALAVLLIRGRTAQTSAAPLPAWQRLEWAALAVPAFLCVMLMPLPLGLTALTGADRFAQNSIAAARLRQAAALDAIDLPVLWFSLTRNRAGTLRVLAIVIGTISAATLARRLTPGGRAMLLRSLVVGGTVVAGAGIVSLLILPQEDTLWWIVPIPHSLPGAAACFVNRNHFGGFAAMLCPGAIIAAARDLGRRRWAGAFLMCLCAVILGAAVLLAESRGGAVAGAAALIVVPFFLFATGHRRVGAWTLLPILALGLTLTFAVLPRVSDSMRELLTPTQSASLQGRMQVWREALLIWRHHPIIGTGPNSFHAAYPMFRRSSVTGHRTHPENLYVETLADSGTAGAALALWAAAAVLAGLRRGRGTEACEPMVTFAVAAALVVAGVHALVDFAPYVPLYSLTLGALVGLALPASPGRGASPLALAAAALAVLTCLWAPAMEKRDSIYHLYKSNLDDLSRALVWSPTSQHAWLHAGRKLMRRDSLPVKRLGERFVTQSMTYDPKNYRHWILLAKLRLKLDDREGARQAYEEAHALREWVRVPKELKEAP